MATVLVVEDDIDILGAVVEALREEGWEVVAAGSAEEAKAAVRSRPVDIVLCDVLLGDRGGIDGPELRKTFARELGLGHVPFALMTAATREIAGLGGERVLRKPFGVSELVDFLNHTLAEPSAANGGQTSSLSAAGEP